MVDDKPEKKMNINMEKIRTAGKCLGMHTRIQEALTEAKQ